MNKIMKRKVVLSKTDGKKVYFDRYGINGSCIEEVEGGSRVFFGEAHDEGTRGCFTVTETPEQIFELIHKTRRCEDDE